MSSHHWIQLVSINFHCFPSALILVSPFWSIRRAHFPWHCIMPKITETKVVLFLKEREPNEQPSEDLNVLNCSANALSSLDFKMIKRKCPLVPCVELVLFLLGVFQSELNGIRRVVLGQKNEINELHWKATYM